MWHHMKVELQASKRSHVADKLFALSKQYSDHMCSLAFSSILLLNGLLPTFPPQVYSHSFVLLGI